MKKTYIITMPNHIGAFLQASKCYSKHHVNMTRVSYNKSVDEHTLFIDGEGSEEDLKACENELHEIGYLRDEYRKASIYLLEFYLQDYAGSLVPILELIEDYHFNISYMSYNIQEGEQQSIRFGLFIDDYVRFNDFIGEAQGLCQLKVLEYNPNGQVFDNSIFYTSFVNGLTTTLKADESARQQLLINANLTMQIVDETGQNPYQAFDSINKFAELLAGCREEKFSPRISEIQLSEKVKMITIEPDCGSNTTILVSDQNVLFIDCGYALYKEEMHKLFNELVDFDHLKEKRVLITHPDLDHCGLLSMFDEIIASGKAKECLALEYEGKPGFRENNRLHNPYIQICKALTAYYPTNPANIHTIWKDRESNELLENIGVFDFEDLHFDVYQCAGGHVEGEIIMVEMEKHFVFTGDLYVNIKGMTPKQSLYNSYAPILMTSVDMDPALASKERKAMYGLLSSGQWTLYGAHGAGKEIVIE